LANFLNVKLLKDSRGRGFYVWLDNAAGWHQLVFSEIMYKRLMYRLVGSWEKQRAQPSAGGFTESSIARLASPEE
jgi:hypothetical protein